MPHEYWVGVSEGLSIALYPTNSKKLAGVSGSPCVILCGQFDVIGGPTRNLGVAFGHALQSWVGDLHGNNSSVSEDMCCQSDLHVDLCCLCVVW